MNKKLIVVSLIALMVLSGVGCAKKENKAPETSQAPGSSATTPNQTTTPTPTINGEEVAKKIFTDIDQKFPGDWSVEGTTLKKGSYTENGNYKIVDETLKVYPGSMVSIFVGEARISGTIKDNKGKRVLEGYPTPSDVPETMKSGKIKVVDAGAMGSASFQKVYIPIKSADKTIAVLTISVAQ